MIPEQPKTNTRQSGCQSKGGTIDLVKGWAWTPAGRFVRRTQKKQDRQGDHHKALNGKFTSVNWFKDSHQPSLMFWMTTYTATHMAPMSRCQRDDLASQRRLGAHAACEGLSTPLFQSKLFDWLKSKNARFSLHPTAVISSRSRWCALW